MRSYFCGRLIDEHFFDELPEGINPCGENGEFHTFCFNGPIFSNAINFKKGEVVYKTYPAPKANNKTHTPEEYGFWYLDLQLA